MSEMFEEDTFEYDKITNKWKWMMDYCYEKRLPAAQNWAWNKAEKAYNEYYKGDLK